MRVTAPGGVPQDKPSNLIIDKLSGAVKGWWCGLYGVPRALFESGKGSSARGWGFLLRWFRANFTIIQPWKQVSTSPVVPDGIECTEGLIGHLKKNIEHGGFLAAGLLVETGMQVSM